MTKDQAIEVLITHAKRCPESEPSEHGYAEALVDTTLSAGWLLQILDEVSGRRAAVPASLLATVWFGLSERGLRRWAHERRLLPQCFLPALYFHRLAQPELQQ